MKIDKMIQNDINQAIKSLEIDQFPFTVRVEMKKNKGGSGVFWKISVRDKKFNNEIFGAIFTFSLAVLGYLNCLKNLNGNITEIVRGYEAHFNDECEGMRN